MPVLHGSLSKREERVAGTCKTVEERGPKVTIKMAHELPAARRNKWANFDMQIWPPDLPRILFAITNRHTMMVEF
ncbi:hypothetical protein ALC53_09715 [Atta colombica]|uniref:Uncharacterized protein n=1 Tax=Atta colombica TaxID=520822 RepID=A0A195B5K3_9HYME|nr:hypothetical protein ALC53_09715 [Atta colombica]